MNGQLWSVGFPARGQGWVQCGAIVEEGRIVQAAPIIGRFIGQPLANLARWALKLGGDCQLVEE